MINKEDLMISDWVQIGENQQFQVEDIVHVGHEYRIKLKGTRTFATEDELHPVHLTPEILEKNGWKHEVDKTEYMVKYDLHQEGKNCWMMWSIKEHNLDVQRHDEKLIAYNLCITRVIIPCDYVHELQHAIRLCGIKTKILV